MKRRMGQRFKKVLTFAMSIIMVVETINCVSMTALASDGITVSAGDAIELNQTLENQVNEAESAAIAADEAAKAAEEALKAAEQLAGQAGDAALETAPDGTYTETVKDVSGNDVEVPVLKDELDDAISEAEDKVDQTNDANKDIIDAAQTEVDGLAAQAVTDTADQLKLAEGAADDAEVAAQKAQDELAKAQAAGDYFTAQKAAKAAQAAYKEAQEAADEAEEAYNKAQDLLDKAIEDITILVNNTNYTVTSGDAYIDADNALNLAQDKLDEATTLVKNAKDAYDSAMANRLNAEEAAAKAAEEAGIADGIADDMVDRLEEIKNVNVDELQKEVVSKTELLEQAKKAQEDAVKNQELVNEEAQKKITEANKTIAPYETAKETIESMEKNGWFSEIESAKRIIEAGKYSRLVRKTWEYKNALETQKKYDAAESIVKNTNVDLLNQSYNTVSQANADIEEAKDKKLEADALVTNTTNDITNLTTTIATVTEFIYSNPNADVYELDEDVNYQKYLSEMELSYKDYVAGKDLREFYQTTIDMNCSAGERIVRVIGQIITEFVYNGTKLDIDWKNLKVVYSNDGLSLAYGKNQDNEQVLITFEKNALRVATIDETEFATYAATFDAAAAAQAKAEAAAAAQKEAEALDKYNKANEALELAQKRLDEAKLNKVNLENAMKNLEIAQRNVDLAEAEWKAADQSAKDAKEAADAAKVELETKPVTVAFYVLNRSMSQPDEVHSYPKPNYSTTPIYGELYSGVLDTTTGTRDYSYIKKYKKGIKDESQVPAYIKVEPSAEQLAEAGVVLKEGEYIKWYVIKTENDGYHVDGFIENQRFTVKVKYGYLDAADDFIEFTKNDGTTYEQSGTYVLGESYEFDSPVIDDYIMETAQVTGVATADTTINVIYTKEPTIPVIINYYRGSITGTLLKTVPLNVAESKVGTYRDVILSNWLNNEKPADCNNGVLVSYYFNETEKAWVGNIVYSPIPVEIPTPGPSPEPTPTPIPEELVPPVTINEEATPTTVRTLRPSAPTPVVEEEPVEVPEEETPLAGVPENNGDATGEDQEVVNVEEEETPLAAGQNCWIHWLILIITAVYTLFELVRSVMRNKKIRELSESDQRVEA